MALFLERWEYSSHQNKIWGCRILKYCHYLSPVSFITLYNTQVLFLFWQKKGQVLKVCLFYLHLFIQSFLGLEVFLRAQMYTHFLWLSNSCVPCFVWHCTGWLSSLWLLLETSSLNCHCYQKQELLLGGL